MKIIKKCINYHKIKNLNLKCVELGSPYQSYSHILPSHYECTTNDEDNSVPVHEWVSDWRSDNYLGIMIDYNFWVSNFNQSEW